MSRRTSAVCPALLVCLLAPSVAGAGEARGDRICLDVERAPVTQADVRDALALRWPARPVAACADADACLVAVRPAAGGRGDVIVTVTCPGAPVTRDELPVAPEATLPRRVAVAASALLAAAPTFEPQPPGEAAPTAPRAPTDRPPPGSPSGPKPSAHAVPAPSVALGLRLGGAVAVESGVSTYKLIVDGRWFVGGRGVYLGGGLAFGGAYERVIGDREASVADRAFFAAVGYRAERHPWFVDVSVGAQYTIPLLEVEGAGSLVEENSGSRLALRGSAGAGLRLDPAVSVVVELAAAASALERDTVLDGLDAVELGTLILDVTLGLEVAF